MSKILTCTGEKDDDGNDYLLNGKNSSNDSSSTINEKSQSIGNDGIDEVVVDVSVNNTKNNLLVYFKCVQLGADGGKFLTRTYSLSTKTGTLGIFDLLDDYFLRRYKFFHSSKTVQAFMYALAEAEKIFKEKSGFSLFEYCAKVSDTAVNDTMEYHKSNNGLNCKLWSGYNIRGELAFFIEKKRSFINMEYFEELGINTVKYFIKNMKYITNKHFVGVCVNITADIPPSLFIDPFINLPMVVYMPQFTEILVTKIAHSFMKTEAFKKAGIDRIKFEIYLLMPETTLSDLKGSMKSDGELVDYDSFEEEDFIIAKFKEYDIIERKINESEFDSIICYS